QQPEGATIGESGARLAPGVALAARSAGEEVGDFAHIAVNGLEVAPNSRGYNLAALTPDGELLDAAVFDTLLPGEAERLATWVAALPVDTIVAGAVADEASLNLTEEAVNALHSLGVSGDLRGRFRWSHAFIGVKGAAPGSALEALALVQPATVFAGLPVDAPQVTGAIHRLEVIPAP
ncbi:MAG TPA: interleukin-like EMT inducer domain-containing protein, partial [Caldilineaceae bacterium]|nr:interleukin-like EMT inducer domain-containing protein [Caldilineaceae bacterium]